MDVLVGPFSPLQPVDARAQLELRESDVVVVEIVHSGMGGECGDMGAI